MLNCFLTFALPLALLLPSPALADAAGDEPSPYYITMKNREFTPLELVVPTDQNLKIIVKNEDPSPIEFKSVVLDRHKIIPPGAEATITFFPLLRGTYNYYDNFNRDAKGFITVQ
jgi:hypothetical protein